MGARKDLEKSYQQQKAKHKKACNMRTCVMIQFTQALQEYKEYIMPHLNNDKMWINNKTNFMGQSPNNLLCNLCLQITLNDL